MKTFTQLGKRKRNGSSATFHGVALAMAGFCPRRRIAAS